MYYFPKNNKTNRLKETVWIKILSTHLVTNLLLSRNLRLNENLRLFFACFCETIDELKDLKNKQKREKKITCSRVNSSRVGRKFKINFTLLLYRFWFLIQVWLRK